MREGRAAAVHMAKARAATALIAPIPAHTGRHEPYALTAAATARGAAIAATDEMQLPTPATTPTCVPARMPAPSRPVQRAARAWAAGRAHV